MLEMLYYGEIYRNEEDFPKGEKFEKINVKVGLENDFTSRLGKAEFRLYDELLTTRNERDSYYYLETFIEGFKIGARMIMESKFKPVEL
jgi:hypothetical protein